MFSPRFFFSSVSRFVIAKITARQRPMIAVIKNVFLSIRYSWLTAVNDFWGKEAAETGKRHDQ
jgi:hypothetical protein